MSDVSIIYIILALIFIYLLLLIPININQTRIYTRNMMKELEAIHETLKTFTVDRSPLSDTNSPPVQCSWCRVWVPAGEIQRFGDVSLCPECAEKGGKRAIG